AFGPVRLDLAAVGGFLQAQEQERPDLLARQGRQLKDDRCGRGVAHSCYFFRLPPWGRGRGVAQGVSPSPFATFTAKNFKTFKTLKNFKNSNGSRLRVLSALPLTPGPSPMRGAGSKTHPPIDWHTSTLRSMCSMSSRTIRRCSSLVTRPRHLLAMRRNL